MHFLVETAGLLGAGALVGAPHIAAIVQGSGCVFMCLSLQSLFGSFCAGAFTTEPMENTENNDTTELKREDAKIAKNDSMELRKNGNHG